MEAIKLYVSGTSQTITLPESMNFHDSDLCATKIGDAIIIMPRKSVRQLMRHGFDSFTEDVFASGRPPLKSSEFARIKDTLQILIYRREIM